MTPRLRAAALGVLVGMGATGCGQQGPLVLPGDVRPIERVDPAAEQPEPNGDERQDER
jgi:predicted small lipoprotein YifL